MWFSARRPCEGESKSEETWWENFKTKRESARRESKSRCGLKYPIKNIVQGKCTDKKNICKFPLSKNIKYNCHSHLYILAWSIFYFPIMVRFVYQTIWNLNDIDLKLNFDLKPLSTPYIISQSWNDLPMINKIRQIYTVFRCNSFTMVIYPQPLPSFK